MLSQFESPKCRFTHADLGQYPIEQQLDLLSKILENGGFHRNVTREAPHRKYDAWERLERLS